MSQILEITNDDVVSTVSIHQCFWDAGGSRIYLHSDGRYAYKDGTPLKSVTELDIIANGVQREAAQRWWKFSGEKESKEYYDSLLLKEREKFGDFQVDNAVAGMHLDLITYTRRHNVSGTISNLHTWREWFTEKPSWWGQAESIQFSDYTYQITLLDKSGKTVTPGKKKEPSIS